MKLNFPKQIYEIVKEGIEAQAIEIPLPAEIIELLPELTVVRTKIEA